MEVIGNLVVVGVYDASATGDVAAAAAVGLFAKRRPIFTSADFEAFSTNLEWQKKKKVIKIVDLLHVSSFLREFFFYYK